MTSQLRPLKSVMTAVVISALVALSACGGDDGDADAAADTDANATADGAAGEPMGTIRAQLNFVPNVEHFGVTYAAEEGLAAAEGIEVDVLPGGQGVDPVQVVGAGRAEIGVTSAEGVMLARAQGVPLVALAAQFQQSPVALTCREDSGITEVSEIAGHTIGVKAVAEALFEVFLDVNGIDRGSFTTKPIGASDVATIIAGAIDCQFTTFAVNEPNTMRNEGVEPVVFLLSENGLPAQSNVYFTSEDALAEHRDTLVAWLRATSAGWEEFMADPEAAASWTVDSGLVDGLDITQQTQQATGMVELMGGGPGLLALDVDTWEQMQENMLGSNELDQPVDLDALLDPTLLAEAVR